MPATHELAFARNTGSELYESSFHSACHRGGGGGVRTDGTDVLLGTEVPGRTSPSTLTL